MKTNLASSDLIAIKQPTKAGGGWVTRKGSLELLNATTLLFTEPWFRIFFREQLSEKNASCYKSDESGVVNHTVDAS